MMLPLSVTVYAIFNFICAIYSLTDVNIKQKIDFKTDAAI